MFGMQWISIWPPAAPIKVGTTVVVVASHLGFWSLNPCRIVYVIDEPYKFGFAYGTVLGHSEIGEERFVVEMNRESEEVSYEILAYSRPTALVFGGLPLARILQRRFARDSLSAMRAALNS
jgi:uncharacterized protein (UPF0548 family)